MYLIEIYVQGVVNEWNGQDNHQAVFQYNGCYLDDVIIGPYVFIEVLTEV